jgi:hypothetical protein
MNLINQILLLVALLSIGIVYGTDMFHAIVVKKAATLSSDQAIADLMGHTHLIADKRMPIIGASGLISSLLLTILNYGNMLGLCSGIAVLALLAHLVIYSRIAKPINTRLTAAAVARQTLADTRLLQQRWDSVITYRAILLGIAMAAVITGAIRF